MQIDLLGNAKASPVTDRSLVGMFYDTHDGRRESIEEEDGTFFSREALVRSVRRFF
jgi:hypothetical protein